MMARVTSFDSVIAEYESVREMDKTQGPPGAVGELDPRITGLGHGLLKTAAL